MAQPEAGTKRLCPESGKKFYDLNKDPIISPYTGESYPLSFFEAEKVEATKEVAKEQPAKAEDAKDDDEDDIVTDGAEVVSLEDADAEVAGEDTDLPSLDDDDDDDGIELADDDNTFLETDDDDDDVSDLVIDADDDEKDS